MSRASTVPEPEKGVRSFFVCEWREWLGFRETPGRPEIGAGNDPRAPIVARNSWRAGRDLRMRNVYLTTSF